MPFALFAGPHAGPRTCPVSLQASKTACKACSCYARRPVVAVSHSVRRFGLSFDPSQISRRHRNRLAAAGDQAGSALDASEEDNEDFDFEDDDAEGDDGYPRLLADSVASEIADVDVESAPSNDSDWGDDVWSTDDPRAEAAEKDDEWEEAILNVSRVTKVVKGGRQVAFRADVVVGDHKGTVGVGCASAKEVSVAVTKAVRDGKKNLVRIPLSKSLSFPHFAEAYSHSAKVMLRPGRAGTGVIAGGAVRVVLQMAGVRNGYGKQLGCSNKLNNARATVQCLAGMRTIDEVAQLRGLSVADLLGVTDASAREQIAAEPGAYMSPTEVPGVGPTPDPNIGINVNPQVPAEPIKS